MRDTAEKLSILTVTQHWVVALGMISLLVVGMYMEENNAYNLYPLHKSMGILILLLVLPRVVWRVINGWPEPLGESAKWQLLAARIVHWVLILVTVLMPLSGMMMSGASGHGLSIFGLELLSPNYLPDNPLDIAPVSAELADLGSQAHGVLGNILMLAVLLHIAGAVKHHLAGDRTLKRMLGR